MPSQETIEAFMLAGVRMVAFIVIAPPFSYSAIPGRVKAMLAIGLALAVAPRVVDGYVSPGTGGYIIQLILELLTGAALGFLVLLVFAAIQSAGYLIDLFGGFQLAQSFDPGSLVNGAQFTKLFQMTALALMFASDSYQLIIAGLARTFDALPLGGGINMADPADAMINGVTQMFLASVQIGGPLLVVLFLTDVGLGLLTRVAPALNAFALGFPLKIFVTLMLISVVFLALPRIVSSLTRQAMQMMTGAS